MVRFHYGRTVKHIVAGGTPTVPSLERADARFRRLAQAAGLAVAILAIDCWTRSGGGIAPLYVGVVAITSSWLRPAALWRVALLCLLLTAIGFAVGQHAGTSIAAVARCLAAMVAIVAATGLAVARSTAGAALQGSRDELRRAERQFPGRLDIIPTHIWTATPDGETDFVNQRRMDFTGPILDWRRIVHPDDQAGHAQRWAEAIRTRSPFENELRVRRVDGIYRWFLIRVAPLCDDRGAVIKWFGCNTDIEDRRRAEQQVAAAERELRAAIDTIPTHVWSATPDGVHDFFNRRRLEYTGDIGWPELVHPDDRAADEAAWQDSIATGRSYQVEVRLRARDGSYRWFLGRAAPQRDAQGRIVKWFGTNTDIDGLKRAEQRIRQAEADLRVAIDTVPGMVWFATDNLVDFVGRQWRDMGHAPAELEGTKWRRFVHPEDLPRLECEWTRGKLAGLSQQSKFRMRTAAGEYRWLQVRGAPLRDEAGRIIRWFGINTDIEDQERAAEALRRSEAHLAYAQRLSRTGSLGWREDGSSTFWSEETYRIFGYDRAVRPEMGLLMRRIHPDDIGRVRRAFDRAAASSAEIGIEFRLLTPEGRVKFLRVLAHAPTPLPGGSELIAAVSDITETRQAEEALQRTQAELAHVTRVATLGELTASIAHEVNQPLAGIVTNGEACLRWLQRDTPDLQEAQAAVQRILADGRRAGEVVRRLRSLARKSEPQHAPLDLNEVVSDSLPLVRRELSDRRVALRLELHPDLPPVRGDRVQLQQVLINLLVNAVQAMAEIRDRPRVLTVRSWPEGGEVLLAVSDVGPGIDAASRERLFEAFYTTRPDGMGMGLSICRSIIEAHGGSIRATANDGDGAVFLVALPVPGVPA
jgi:PAS domain S-box-containing protein